MCIRDKKLTKEQKRNNGFTHQENPAVRSSLQFAPIQKCVFVQRKFTSHLTLDHIIDISWFFLTEFACTRSALLLSMISYFSSMMISMVVMSIASGSRLCRWININGKVLYFPLKCWSSNNKGSVYFWLIKYVSDNCYSILKHYFRNALFQTTLTAYFFF